jgi:hypothetical protein
VSWRAGVVHTRVALPTHDRPRVVLYMLHRIAPAPCSYPYLLFGLDSAVYESGGRQLPWQADSSDDNGDSSSSSSSSRGFVTEAGSRHSTRTRRGSVRERAAAAPAHWLSHPQEHTTLQQRDRAVQQHYARPVYRL